LTAQKEA
jgi:hypothetical protein